MVSVSPTGSLYAGTSLTLTCIVTLDPNVNSNETVSIEWSCPEGGTFDDEGTTSVMGGSVTLIISPLTDQDDDGLYTCTGTVTGGTSATASDNATISVMGNNFTGC